MKGLIGSGVALITPFKEDNNIDFEALGKLIEHQIAGGINYLVSLGTTGETATLTKQEKSEILAFTAEIVDGRIPLVGGIGGNNTQEILDNIHHFDLSKYSALLSVSPYYNKPTQEGIFQHYKAISKSSPLPIILYNVPGRTGSNIEAKTTTRLAHECSNIIGIKEASGNFTQYSEILRDKPDEFLLISGDDALALPMIALGASGVISVLANALPAEVNDLTRLCLDGDFKNAGKVHARLIEIINLCFVEGNPAGVKAILQQKGIIEDWLRLPLTSVGDETRNKIAKELEKLQTAII